MNLGVEWVTILISGGAIVSLLGMPNIALSQTARSRPVPQPVQPKPARSPQQHRSPEPPMQNLGTPAVLSPGGPVRLGGTGRSATAATSNGSESVCYLEMDDGRVIDLVSLCGKGQIPTPQRFVPARLNVKDISEFDNRVYGD